MDGIGVFESVFLAHVTARGEVVSISSTFVPELEGQFNLWWYPTEGIQIRVGYSLMAFFNTVASKQPIDFNFGGLNPTWDEGVYRLFDGINAGISFIF